MSRLICTLPNFRSLPTSGTKSRKRDAQFFADSNLASAFTLRRDPRLLKLPPYLSFLCIIVGIAWLFLLPLNEYSRKTYISENALLPGQVRTHFGGSDQNIFRAYRHEISALENSTNAE